ncbi:hypothetical protein [Acinetobacter baumannii]|uniref:hypothetical protein n=1 Tax=Acinetobacter baumannii TaxID=470 RepID=UPI002223DC7E|nr:hypothetical protein [Acinetobacter baumannii]MCW1893153.1 hypothetical protein [Acinetobacter baumannii]
MAVPEQTPFIEYTANGTTTVYPLTFDCDKSEFLIVSLDGNEAPVGSWALTNGSVVFNAAPVNGVLITIERNTPFRRTTDYQSYNNSFRPSPVNKDFDLIWWKLQELGYRDQVIWLALIKEIAARIEADKDLQKQILDEVKNRIDAIKNEELERISNDQALRNLIISLIDQSIESGSLNALAITHVETFEALEELTNVWEGRDIYVDDIGIFKYSSITEKWNPISTIYITPRIFGAKGNGADDDSEAIRAADNFSIANNATVIIDRDYVAKNLTLGGRYLGTGGRIISEINGATDNVIVAKSGLKIDGVRFKTKVVGQDGGGNFGYVIRLGDYYQALDGSSVVENFSLNNLVFDEEDTGFKTACIEVLGLVRNGDIKNITHNGNYYVLILHWGGDVDVSDPHSSIVTYSWHPYDLRIENPKHNAIPEFSTYSKLDYSYVFSACYDIDAKNLRSDKCRCTLWVMPGDVYNQVAVAEQKDKVFTNINIDGVTIDDPRPNGTAPIFIEGRPATPRTNQTRWTALDDKYTKMQASVKKAKVAVKSPVNGSYCSVFWVKNLDIDLDVSGVDNNTAAWCHFENVSKSKLKLKGRSLGGVRLMCDEDTEIEVNSTGDITSTQVLNIQPIRHLSNVLLNAASKGATEITITRGSGTTTFGQASKKGCLVVYQNRVVAVIDESCLVIPTTTSDPVTLKISPLLEDIPAGSLFNLQTMCGGKVRGIVGNGNNTVYASNTRRLDLSNLKVRDSKVNGVGLDGVMHHELKIKGCDFKGTKPLSSDTIACNIRLLMQSTSFSEFSDCEISSNKFDEDSVCNVNYHIYSESMHKHKGLKIIHNTGSPVLNNNPAIQILNSTYGLKNTIQQVYGNCFKGGRVADDRLLQGMLTGNNFIGSFAAGVDPSTVLSTYFDLGMIIYNAAISATTQATGWVCIAEGMGASAKFMRLDYFGTTKSVTSAQLASIASDVNTSFKYLGLDVYTSDTQKFYKSKGSAANAAWVAFDGSTITPS